MSRILKPPAPLELDDGERSLFLAGSIEMGQAEPWQAEVERALVDEEVVILNPRRDHWDASWEQSIDNPLFRDQVEWELSGQELATVIAMYFRRPPRPRSRCWNWGCSLAAGNWSFAAPPDSGGGGTSRSSVLAMGYHWSISSRP